MIILNRQILYAGNQICNMAIVLCLNIWYFFLEIEILKEIIVKDTTDNGKFISINGSLSYNLRYFWLFYPKMTRKFHLSHFNGIKTIIN